VRYIGNKTKLLRFIGDVLDERAVRPGHALDAFAGTASVGHYLKTRGFRVTSCDLMTYSLAFQKAYIEVDVLPDFQRLLAPQSPIARLESSGQFLTAIDRRFGLQSDLFENHEASDRAFQKVAVF